MRFGHSLKRGEVILKPSRRVRRLDINFAERPPLAAWARWLILAAGAATLAGQAHSYVLTRQRLAEVEARVVRLSLPRGAQAVAASDPKTVEEQIAAVERVVTRLTFEWHALFAELERAPTDDVALASVEPAPETRSLSVSGIAKDYPALLTYLSTLRNSKVLNKVFLKRHELARNQPVQGISFTLTASWRQLEQASGQPENADASRDHER